MKTWRCGSLRVTRFQHPRAFGWEWVGRGFIWEWGRWQVSFLLPV